MSQPHQQFTGKSGPQVKLFLILLFTLSVSIFSLQARELPQTLKIGYRTDSEPLQYLDSRGEAQGILIDYWKTWAKGAGITLEFVGGTNAQTQSWLEQGQVDLLAGLFANTERGKTMAFSAPLLHSNYYLFFAPEKVQLNTVTGILSHPVGVTEGSYHHHWLQTHYPQAQIKTYHGYKALFQAANSGEVVSFITQPLYLNEYTKSFPFQRRILPLQPALYSHAYRAAVKKEESELLKAINQHIQSIDNHQKDAISAKWSGFHWEYQEPAEGSADTQNGLLQQLTDSERKWLSQHPRIPIGVDGRWPPVDFVNGQGKHTGILNDYLELFSQKLGVEFEPRVFGSFKDMVKATRAGTIPVGATIVKTEERSQELWFTPPYFSAVKVIVGRSGETPFRDLQDLHGYTLALEEGFYLNEQLAQDHPKIKVKNYPTTEAALKALSFGEVDAYIGNQAVISWFLDELQLTNLVLTGDPGFAPGHQRFAIHKEAQWQPLVGILNKTIDSLSRQERQHIHNTWIHQAGELQDNLPLFLSSTQQQWIEQHPEWRLGIDPNWAPFEFIDEQGLYAGISADVMSLLAKELEVKLTPETPTNWQQTLEAFKEGELDILPTVSPTPERHDYMLFTKPYLKHPYVILVHEETHFVTQIEDLKGKRVGMISDYAITEQLAQNYPELELVPYESNLEALMALSAGEVDAYIGLLTASSWVLKEQGIRNVKVTGTTSYSFEQSIGVRKDWPELVEILNQAIDSISNTQRTTIDNRWFSVQFEHQANHYQILRAIGITCLILLPIILTILIWNRKLKQAKEHLKASREKLAEAKQLAEQANQFKSQFLANMSHEIRTPMNAILGMTHLMLSTELSTKQKDYADKIKRSSLSLLGIINDILDFSKVEAGQLQVEQCEFQLEDVFINLSNLLSIKAAEKELDILINLDPLLPDTLVGDALRLEQILINLSQNAIKFTEQGDVVITARQLQHDSQRVEIEFSVEDTGIGIAPEQLEQLFLPFTQADSSTTRTYGGTGLGLSICKQLVELMGGTIQATSTPGEGSCFSFCLSFKQAHQEHQKFAIGQELRGMKVLVVDDNPHARQIFRELLSSISFDVETASNGEVALQLLQQNNRSAEDAYKLVIMDWKMPGLNGIETSRAIRQLTLAHTPAIIMVTAYGHEHIMQEAEQEFIDGFLIKPVNASLLFDTIIRIFSETLPESSEVELSQAQLSGQILLVEDHPINQQVASELLNQIGLDVTIANHGQEALEWLNSKSFDLILMDIQMPVMDGYETTSRIRQHPDFAHLPVIAMTAHAMKGDKEKCLAAGLDDHIAKPIDPEHLYQVLKQWLEHSSKPLLDQTLGISRVGGNQQLYHKLVNDFYQHHKNDLLSIEQQLGEEGTQDAKITIHTIRGVAGNIGASLLEKAAANLEKELISAKSPLSSSAWSEFKYAFTALFEAIQNQHAAIESCSQAPLKPLADRSMLQLLIQQIEEGSPKSRETLEQLKPSLEPQLFEELFEKLNEFEFDEAISVINSSLDIREKEV